MPCRMPSNEPGRAYSGTRRHAGAQAASLFADNVPESVYENLIGAVHNYLPALYRYYELRRRKMTDIYLDMDGVCCDFVGEAVCLVAKEMGRVARPPAESSPCDGRIGDGSQKAASAMPFPEFFFQSMGVPSNTP